MKKVFIAVVLCLLSLIFILANLEGPEMIKYLSAGLVILLLIFLGIARIYVSNLRFHK